MFYQTKQGMNNPGNFWVIRTQFVWKDNKNSVPETSGYKFEH